MQRSGSLRGLLRAAHLAATPAASCGADGSLRGFSGASLLAATPAASCGAQGASRFRAFSSRGDDWWNGDSRTPSSPIISAGNQEEPGVDDPFRGGGVHHDSGGGGSGGGSQQLPPQGVAAAATPAELHRPQLSAAGDSAPGLRDFMQILKEMRQWQQGVDHWQEQVDERQKAAEKLADQPHKAAGTFAEETLQQLKQMRAEQTKFAEETLQQLDQVCAELKGACDGLSALAEFTASTQLQQNVGDKMQVHANVPLTGAESTAACLLRDAPASTKETAVSALVERLRGLPGLRAVLRYFLTRARTDLEGLSKHGTSAAGSAAWAVATQTDVPAAAEAGAKAANAARDDTATIQGHLAALQALEDQLLLLVATAADTTAEAHLAAAAVTVLSGAQGYIDTRRGSGSGDDDGSDGTTEGCTPYAAAVMMLEAMRTNNAESDKLLLLRTEGPVSMLVLSALQPASMLQPTAAVNNSRGSGSDGSASSGGGGGGGGGFNLATRLEVDALAVRLTDSSLLVIIQEAKLSSSLPTAREQVARIGTIFAYAYNVAVAASAFGEGKPPPQLRLEGQIVVARPTDLPPEEREKMVELVPAEGGRHQMRVRVTGLAGCTFDL